MPERSDKQTSIGAGESGLGFPLLGTFLVASLLLFISNA